MTGNICWGNENELSLESCFEWAVSGYYESPFSTATNSVTNLCLNKNFCYADYMKSNGKVFHLEKKTFLISLMTKFLWNLQVYFWI